MVEFSVTEELPERKQAPTLSEKLSICGF